MAGQIADAGLFTVEIMKTQLADVARRDQRSRENDSQQKRSGYHLGATRHPDNCTRRVNSAFALLLREGRVRSTSAH